MSETVIPVEQVVVGPNGDVHRFPSAKRRVAYQASIGRKPRARLGIARVVPKPLPDEDGDSPSPQPTTDRENG